MSRPTAIALLLLFSLVTVRVADEPDESWLEPNRFEGEPCVEINAPFLAAGSGAKFLPFTGRVVTKDAAGEVLPVKKAEFWGPAYRNDRGKLRRRKYEVRVSKAGTFNGTIGLSWDEHIVCREDRIAFERWIGEAEVLVTAKRCLDKTIRYGQDSAGIEIELECDS